MNRFNMLILVLQFMFLNAKAQSVSSDMDMASRDVVSNFHPSLAVVIGILSIMFSLTFVLLLYAKFCHRASSVHNTTTHIVDGLPGARSCVSGIDKTVIESLPFFRFSSLRGSREGLECAVCLSKFEDIEILRLLPKCKHAFHIDCIDLWLEKHSSCPLCRHRVSADDLSFLRDSTSLRYLRNQSELRDDSNLELYVEREENRHGSSRFSIGSSFRKSEKAKKEEELPIQQFTDSDNENNKVLHKFNHKIIISDVVLKNRWSNVSSSDLFFLNSEMLIDISSNRFSSLDANSNLHLAGSKAVKDGEMMNIKEEMERKRQFESKFSKIKQNDSFPFPVLHTAASESQNNPGSSSKVMNPSEKRSMSEITVHSRFTEFNTRNISTETNDIREERRRRLWLPIARRTVQWFVNRERRSTQAHNARQSMNV